MASYVLIWQVLNIYISYSKSSVWITQRLSEQKKGLTNFKWKFELLCYHIAYIIKSLMSLHQAHWRLPESFLLSYKIAVPAGF